VEAQPSSGWVVEDMRTFYEGLDGVFAPIRINAISPGIVRTPWWDRIPAPQREATFKDAAEWIPVGRVGAPDDVAQAVLLVATNGYMTGP